MEHVCAYVRVSSEDLDSFQNNSVSIENQLNLIREYAISNDFIIDREYIDDGYSGINFLRPAFRELIADISDGKVKCIITKDISRLGREAIDTVYYVSEYFPRNNIRYIAINDHYDSFRADSLSSDIVLGIKSIINDRYVKDSSVKRELVARMKTSNREFIGPYAPYGYRIVKVNKRRTLEIDKYAADVVKRIFRSIASGMKRSEVADSLNYDKILPPMLYKRKSVSSSYEGYKWTDKIIYRILRDRTYTGCLVERKSFKSSYRDKKRKGISIFDRELFYNVHPIIIDNILFNKANSKVKRLRRYNKIKYNGCFNNLVVCGECGKKMSVCKVEKDGGVIKYYFSCRRSCCNRIIYDNTLKRLVEKQLENIFDNYVDSKMVINNLYSKLISKKRIDKKILDLQKDIELSDRNIKDLYIKKVNGDIMMDEFIVGKDYELQLKDRKIKLLNSYFLERDNIYRRERIIDYYRDFINNFVLLKDYISDFIDNIVIYKDDTVQISFRFFVN